MISMLVKSGAYVDHETSTGHVALIEAARGGEQLATVA